MNSIRILNTSDIMPFPPCCYDCKYLNQSDDYQFACQKGRIFPFKKNTCKLFETVRMIENCHDSNHPWTKPNSTPWGGSRPGAGRKKIDNPKTKWSGYLDTDLIKFLRFISSRDMSQSKIIEFAVKTAFKNDFDNFLKI